MKNTIRISSCFILLSTLFLVPTTFGAGNIDVSCFRESTRFQADTAREIKADIISRNDQVFFVQNKELLPYKILGGEKPKYIEYTVISNSSGNKMDLKNTNDGNSSTSFAFDGLTDTKKSITLDFNKTLEANSFDYQFIFRHQGNISFFIGENLSSLKNVQEDNIRDFSFRYLKINFDNYNGDGSSIKTEIAEVNFFIPGPETYIIKPNAQGSIEAYRNYDCESEKIQSVLNEYMRTNNLTRFSIDSSVQEINASFAKNPDYNNDFDSDSVANSADNCPFRANKDQQDSDMDGVGNVCDLDLTNKNPNDHDSDNDGNADSLDNCRYIFNPTQKDSNADGVGDACSDDDNDGILGKNDNCPLVSNPDQKDVNINNVGDACEFDKDLDGVFDSMDNCITTANSDQKDTDHDGVGDTCDNCKLYNPNQKDADHNNIGDVCQEALKYEKENDSDTDSIIDFKDNCSKISNSDQKDTDHDGVGDACDNCTNIQNQDQRDENKNGKGDMCEDSDGDGINGFQDNCPTVSNKDQKDSNNSGVGDLCKDEDSDGIIAIQDNCPYDYNRDQNDVDMDKIGDKCDTKDDRYIESNKPFFAGIMFVIIACFGVGIYAMMRKLKGK